MNRLLLLLPAALLAACSPVQDVVVQDITGVELKGLGPQRLSLRVDARVENPNGFRIHVEDPDVDLFLNDRFVGKAVLDSALVLAPKATAVYPVHLHADLQGGPLAIMLIGSALSGQVKVGAKGSVAGRSGPLRKRFPFEVSHVVSLRE